MEKRSSDTHPETKPTPSSPDSYRSISLTSCLCKLLERIINKRLKWYIDKNRLLPKFQTGFRNGCSTYDNLIRLGTAINTWFNDKKTTTAVFLNLEKAYDNTWITGLIYKISKLKISGAILRWIQNFLTDRSIAVRVDHSLSSDNKLKRRVPQGCVLSPMLFNIMMANFPPPEADCETSLFADDDEIHTTASSKRETEIRLQRYLNIIEDWAKLWKILNPQMHRCIFYKEERPRWKN